MNALRSLLLAGSAVLAATAPTLAAPPDDTIVVGLSADASTFDPAQISSRDNANIAKHIFGTLYQVTFEGEIQPYLAKDVAISEDGKTYTFTLNEGLTCDDGEPLTAEDVAYSFTRPADPDLKFTGNTPGFVYSTLGFAGAEAVDDLTVNVMIKEKNSLGLGMMSQVYIHCKDSYEAMSADDAALKPIGSGSYKLASWARGSEVVLEKVKDPGTFQNIIFRIIPEASTRTAELIAGNVDIITNVSPDQVGAIDASGSASVKKVSGTRRMFVGFNQNPVFAQDEGGAAIAKAEVRRALQYAVDVPAICAQLLGTECERAASLVNPPNDDPSIEPYPYDPEMAETLLDEAGYPRQADGTRFSIKLQGPRGRYLNDANVIQAIGQFLNDVGVNTEVELLEWASVYSPLLRTKEMGPLFFLGMGGVTWSPQYDMAAFATPDAAVNYPSWTEPKWFDQWPALRNAATPEEERTIINSMLEVFHEEAPWLMLYFQPDFYGVSNRLDWTPRRDEEIDLFYAKLAQ